MNNTLLDKRLCLVCLDIVPVSEGILFHEQFLVCSIPAKSCLFDLLVMSEIWEEETRKSFQSFLVAVRAHRQKGSTPLYQQHLVDEWRTRRMQ